MTSLIRLLNDLLEIDQKFVPCFLWYCLATLVFVDERFERIDGHARLVEPEGLGFELFLGECKPESISELSRLCQVMLIRDFFPLKNPE